MLLGASPALAQFDPARVVREPPEVAARFPEPAVRYATPAFQDGRTDFPTHAEVLGFLGAQAGLGPHLRLLTIGQSQRGLAMPMALLAAGGQLNPALPTVLITAQQHGNEPASGEAALALVQQLIGPRADLLARVNVLVVPRSNPDGAEAFARATASGIDVNRDHLLLRTPEARAIAEVVRRYRPQVVVDLHEFTVAGRWVDKFGVMQKYDALVQAASVGNLDPQVARAAREWFVQPLQAAWSAQALDSFAYHTTSPDTKDLLVSMGGVQPDTGRNVAGLRPAISVLIEVRGVGLGRAHLLRRVHTSVLGALTVIDSAGQRGPELGKLLAQAGEAIAASACRGDVVVAATHTETRQQMMFVDARSGADRPIEVRWRAAEPLQVERARPRPCGYLVGLGQTATLQRLAWLGVRMHPLNSPAAWTVERYELLSEGTGQRVDARGAIDDGADADVRLLQVATNRESRTLLPGTAVYVPMDQPMAALIAAALEPDSQNSYAANRQPGLDVSQLWRVMVRPMPQWLGAATP